MLRVQKSQSQPPEDNRSSEEVIKSERCAIPREVYNDIAIIASAQKKSNCEVQIEALKEWTGLKKLQAECTAAVAEGVRDDRCVNSK
jgi:hypothetical protein